MEFQKESSKWLLCQEHLAWGHLESVEGTILNAGAPHHSPKAAGRPHPSKTAAGGTVAESSQVPLRRMTPVQRQETLEQAAKSASESPSFSPFPFG